MYKQYKENGAAGLISKRRGKTSNRKLPDSIKEIATALVKEHYHYLYFLVSELEKRGISIIENSSSTLTNHFNSFKNLVIQYAIDELKGMPNTILKENLLKQISCMNLSLEDIYKFSELSALYSHTISPYIWILGSRKFKKR